MGLLTPICKSFGTDLGNELTSLGLQVHGGMGFIEETGVAQYYRDVRITAIYEGTNGIQAADLVGRKLGVRDGASFLEFLAQMREIDAELAAAGDDFESIRSELATQLDALESATQWMLRTARQDPNAHPRRLHARTFACGGSSLAAGCSPGPHSLHLPRPTARWPTPSW